MSRALDKDSVVLLQDNTPSSIYEDISSALCQLQDGEQLLEIELLGKSHPLPAGSNFLLEGNSIAIPKIKLVQAFVIARQIFFKLYRNCPQDKQQDLQNATAVILLMDPEHLTAANARKRLVQSSLEILTEKVQAILKKELLFVDSFLTARLHRHNKSPTLWSHRRWILEKAQSMRIACDLQQDVRTVILVAAERHPRNYYAWSHLRWLVQNTGVEDKTKKQILTVAKDWCLRHPSDTSGFSFLLFCLASPAVSKNVSRIEASTFVCKEVLHIAVSFKWTHESVWVFLRTLIASGSISKEQRAPFLSTINELLTTSPENAKARSTLKDAMQWYEEYQQTSPA
ncbi:hypothetical protein G7Y89_g12927 [Cudoniella acicularis]|uniref:Protein prenyltransferase alpha subunit repeat-containing protein 1 n=1 Tax=Cudoniella acicularis TaxID=354080 RepID=A0A8H4VWJ5_9HELO|nr:hypothetical protein G7Y89_g12927 [Cudoniella acicularis]